MSNVTELAVVVEARLDELEVVIEAGIDTFVEVGLALLEIRDRRLYRSSYATFEKYCQTRWGFSGNYARKLMSAAEIGTIVPVHSEAVARELTPLKDDLEDVKETWAEATSKNPRPTAQEVRAVVRRRRAKSAAVSQESTGADSAPVPDGKLLAAARADIRSASDKLHQTKSRRSIAITNALAELESAHEHLTKVRQMHLKPHTDEIPEHAIWTLLAYSDACVTNCGFASKELADLVNLTPEQVGRIREAHQWIGEFLVAVEALARVVADES